MFPNKVMGLQLLSLARSPVSGMRVIKPLLMNAEIAPELSMAVKACAKVGATSSAYSWKNSMRIPSWPGALPLGKAFMATRMSWTVRALVSCVLMSCSTFTGTLDQHSTWAPFVPGASASEE